ncbi:MAG TPA: serine/threonine protein kinase [Gammaproteobacteria bacterium]|nr:serine/threonine protein kinase [Gammaproteobacteria bacterium]
MDKDTASTPSDYSGLSPDTLLNAIDSCGLQTDGRLLALNSYENRVYQTGIESEAPVIAKFYRPGRWTDAAIAEEHAFSLELTARELPVIAPMVINGNTLQHYRGYRFAVYPRQGGYWPELNSQPDRQWIGRVIARMHAAGSASGFSHRPVLDIDSHGHQSRRFLLEQGFIPAHLDAAYRSLSEDLLSQITSIFAEAGNICRIRIHADCHPGNILWTEQGPHFVDLDDCRTGPAIQDIWMLISGERHEMQVQLADIIEGYQQFHDLDLRELRLIEPLRTLRIMHYAAWLANRWEDPAFPRAFPWFNTSRYWEEHILALREQAGLLNETPLVI